MASERHRRRGAILLECLVAMTLVMLLGLPALALSRAAVSALAEATRAEALAARAERTLASIALLRRGELDQRLGWHRISGFAVNIQRPERGFYRVAVADTTAPDIELLVTVVYRAAEEEPR
jgi:DNA-binding IclR family transcriptional regulator